MSSLADTTADSDGATNTSNDSSFEENYNNNAAALKRKTANGQYKLNDTIDVQCELKSLRGQVAQLQSEIAAEREATITIRKKLTTANKEKLEQASKFNEATTKIQSQKALLEAELEKNREYTEGLEFDIARLKKQHEKEKKSFIDKEEDSGSAIQHLEETLCEAQKRIKLLEAQREDSERNVDAQIEQLKDTVADRDRILQETMQEQQNIISERNSLHEMVQQQQEAIEAHREQFSELQTEFEKTKQHLIEANSQIKTMKMAEEEYKTELETLAEANKELGEAIEAERTAHMESKFNSELVQLKIHDLENSCQTHKGVSDELQETVDGLAGKLRELEQALNDEIASHKATHAKLERCEKEYALSQRQLQAELTDKRSLVSNLKQQLDMHQSNVDDLKTELNRAKKRQKYFEETYGGSMRELELMVANFDISPSSAPRSGNDGSSEKPLSPHAVLDTIRYTLQVYKKNLEDKTAELKKISETYNSTSLENSSTKDKLWAKEKALEEAQRALNHTTKEVEVLRKTTSDQDDRLVSLRNDLQEVKKEYENLQTKYSGLCNDMTNCKMSNLEQSEQKMRFIHGLYQRLVIPTSSSQSGSGGMVKVQPFEKFSWDDLTEMVLEQTVTLINQNNHLKEQLGGFEHDVEQKSQKLEAVRSDYEKRISEMNTTQEKQSKAWAEEKQYMEQEYKTLLTENQKQQQMSQKSYDEAWEQVRQTTSSLEQMEKEISDLKTRISVLQKHNSSLLCAFGLMCGAYFPLMTRSKQLVHQRNILEEQLNRYNEFKSQITVLLHTLSSDEAELHTKPTTGPYMLMKFRKVALVIIAAYRIRKSVTSSRRVFQFTDSHCSQSIVCLGSLKFAKRRSSTYSENEAEQPDDVLSETDVVDWLSNKEVISCVMLATEEVMDALRRYTHKNSEKTCRPGLLMSAARTSFKKLIGRMETLYPAGSIGRQGLHKDRYSFVRQLTKGLHDVMSTCSLEQKARYLPTQHTLTSLQERVLNFIKMLHDSEIERRGLRQRVNTLSEAEQDLRQSEQTIENLQLELNVLKSQQDRMVAVEKLDEVVAELDSTLARERKAQELLHEQSQQLREITRRLDEEELKRSEQEGKLKESLQSMERNKGDMVQKTEIIQQLKIRMSHLELERTQLQNNVYDAEQALRTAAKDREYMAIYVKNLLASFEKCRADVIRRDISQLINAKNFLPEGQPTSEMLAVQSLVNAYTDSLRALHNHITGLNDEINSHRRHIARLKEELSAACTRQMGAPIQAADFYGSQDRYNRLESTRLGHHLEGNITPRFDKSLEFGSDTDFMSVGNEPEHSTARADRSSSSRPTRLPPASDMVSPSKENFKPKPHSSSAFKPAGRHRRDNR